MDTMKVLQSAPSSGWRLYSDRSCRSCTTTAAASPARAPAVQPRARSGTERTQRAASKNATVSVAVDPMYADTPSMAPTTCAWAPAILLSAVAAGLAFCFLKPRFRTPANMVPEPLPGLPVQRCEKEYQMALARSRQAVCVQKAVAHMRAGEPARAMVELNKALQENCICRSPLLDGHQTRAELTDLYKLHLMNTQVPPNFATLLQLREMLGLRDADATAIEDDVLEAPANFSI